MKIIIVGAGNMGSIFAARLITAGHTVRLVARNERLRDLQKNGLRLRHQYGGKNEHYTPPVHAELASTIEADLILVTVQRPHIDTIMPELIAHPCGKICFMFNCSEIDPEWQRALDGRLVWGFPAALGGTKNGIVEYLVMPGYLRFLQITTVGVTDGGKPDVALEIAAIFRKAGVATAFNRDMRSWLISHTALMLPGMAMCEKKYVTGQSPAFTLAESHQVATAQKECFTVIRAAGLRVTPRNLYLLSVLPLSLITPFLWLGFKTKALQRAALDHVDHAHDEMKAMYAGIKHLSEKSGTGTSSLDKLFTERLMK